MRRAVAVVVVAVAAQWGCSSSVPSPSDTAEDRAVSPTPTRPERLQAQPADLEPSTTVLPAGGPAQAAAAVSATFFEQAPVVLVAAADDPDAQAQAAAAASDLGAPVLLSPPSGEAPPTTGRGAGAQAPAVDPAAGMVADELVRLAPRVIVTFGEPAGGWARDQDGGAQVIAAGDLPGGTWSLDDIELDDGAVVIDAADRPDDVLMLVEQASAGAAPVATAEASGATVIATTGFDPRADPAAIAALAAEPLPERVVALGRDFGPADRLRQRLEVAATGVELPGGGQVLFPFRRMVALYGHPGAPVLGVLGEQGADTAVTRAQDMAAGYAGSSAEPIVPAFEIITTVASSSAGPDGDFSAESEVADLRPWVDAAGRAGVYVVLDLQPGRTDFLTQAQRYEELLAEPHVGLALDPEWRLGPDQRHMAQIGSVGVDEVNAVASWLAGLTRERRLPQKLLLLHQFQLRMITDRARLDTSHDELAVLIHADGFGTPGQKIDTWNALRSEPVANVWWGWKNFIDEDQPTFTPAETYAVDPAPWFVSYQ